MKNATSGRSDVKLWIETVAAGGGLTLAVVTLFWREWIEFLFGFDPDHGNGSVEWLIIFGLAIVGIALGVAARSGWRTRTLAAAERA